MLGHVHARHLLARTGLGPRPDDIDAFARLSKHDAVDALLNGIRTDAHSAPPKWLTQPLGSGAEERARRQDLKRWWYREMLTSPSPLTERLVLMWHNHFTTSVARIQDPRLMYHQLALFRRHAGGSFRDLLGGVVRDPAMLLYLDNQLNHRLHPNENFARELLELFTLGRGHYSENDIREVARAFTGWRVDRKTGRFAIHKHHHDRGNKTIFGRSGHWDGTHVVDMLLDQSQLYQHIAARVWRAFIHALPGRTTLDELATAFERSGGDLEHLLRSILLHDAFWLADERGARIKSPVEFLVGLARAFDLKVDEAEFFLLYGRRLKQDLLDPPNVKGWPGGTAWINAQTLLDRQRIVRHVAYDQRAARGPSPALSSAHMTSMTHWLMARQPVSKPPTDHSPHAVIAWLLQDPAFQLT